MSTADLSLLKEILKDDTRHISIAIIEKIDLAEDKSFLKCLVKLLPDEVSYVARMTWESVGNGSGIFSFPSVNDLVLVAFADGDIDSCFVIKRLTSKEDKIPVQAVDGSTAIISLNGKKTWLTSDTRINLSKCETEPTENLVLGQQLKALLIATYAKLVELNDKIFELSTDISTHTHVGNLGYPTSPPNEAAQFIQLAQDFTLISEDFDDLSASPVEDELILSDLAFTEKGS